MNKSNNHESIENQNISSDANSKNVADLGNFLVVGDWFVDEYWFVVRHHSDISSHTGPLHYRIVSEPNDAVKDLCGGGLVARVFYELDYDKTKSKRKDQYNLFGLGRWNPADDRLLPHFIHANCQAVGIDKVVKATFSLQPMHCKQRVDITIKNLAANNPKYATTRCIRAYRFVGGRFEQLHRIDWEPVPAPDQGKQTETEAAIMEEFFPQSSFAAIIVEDHKKGVIDDRLIKTIKDKDRSSRWFVRTKNNRIRQVDKAEWPSWLRDIEKIELLAVGPEIACYSYPINGLLAKNNCLAEHAYTLIDTLIDGKSGEERKNRKVKCVALTSDKLEVVVLLGDFCFVAKPLSEIKNIELEKINWTTAFFAALAYEMLMVEKPKEKPEWNVDQKICQEMVERAIKNAHEHSGVKLPQVLQIPTDKSSREVSSSDAAGSGMSESKVTMVGAWSTLQEQWGMAKKDKGIIEYVNPKKRPRLELWRASTDLPGYIACIEEKRAAIRRIWQKIKAFTQQGDAKNSLSILLEADPAVGKSYLARTLADRLKCEFVWHDITQMIERAELLDLFDMVANAQAQSSKPVFVFVDEINATLGGSPVYGAFLSPLEAATYMRNGKRIELKPCIWMFAGTPDSSGMDEKRADFESRMTLIERIDYRSIMDRTTRGVYVATEASLEQVYLGAKMINDAFNDVIQIDIDILEVFATLPPEKAPARLIKRLATSLENVQYGRVHKGNCTSLEWHRIIEDRIQPEDRWKWTRELKDSNAITYVEIDLS